MKGVGRIMSKRKAAALALRDPTQDHGGRKGRSQSIYFTAGNHFFALNIFVTRRRERGPLPPRKGQNKTLCAGGCDFFMIS